MSGASTGSDEITEGAIGNIFTQKRGKDIDARSAVALTDR
jgi:hypothetical protein